MKLPNEAASLLKLSRYTQFLEEEDYVALFHTLRFHPVYISHAMAAQLSGFRNPLIVSDFLNDVLPDEREQWIDLIAHLRKTGMLIEDDSVDESTLAYYRHHIPKPGIYVAFFILTDACNFNCSYCFIEHDRHKNGFEDRYMSERVALDGLDFFVKQVQRNKQRKDERKAIQFYGGEPLLNFKVMRVLLVQIEGYKRERLLPDDLELTVVTNGSLLTREVVSFLKQHGVGITISIDGDELSTHNRVDHAGRQVYNKIMKGIQHCQEAGAHFALSITLTEETISNPRKTLDTLYAINPDRVGFNLLLPGEHFSDLGSDYAIRASNFVILAYEEIRQRGIIYEDNFIRKVEAFAQHRVSVSDCGAVGGNQVIIHPDGSVGACEGFLGERKFMVTDVQDADFDPAANELYREWGRRMPLLMDLCQDCMALGICGGGCLVSAIKNENDLFALNSINCDHMKNTIKWLIRDLYKNTIRKDEPTFSAS